MSTPTFKKSTLPLAWLFACYFIGFPLSAMANSELTWTGCGISKKAFMVEVARAYKQHTGIDIAISGGGATKGIHNVANGRADLGGTCRHRMKSITNQVVHSEADAQLIHVAWDALVPIVNKDNRVYDISMTNLKRVYDGEITSWRDLAGDAEKLSLYTRTGKDSGVGHMFRLLVFNNNPAYEFKGSTQMFPSSAPLEKKIEAQKYGVGITGVSSAKKRNGLRVLTINGVAPSKKNIIAGEYPLFRPIYLTSNQQPSEKVQHFIDYILSDEGQDIISKTGTVNLKEGRGLVALWQAKMQKMGLKIADPLKHRSSGSYRGSSIQPPPSIAAMRAAVPEKDSQTLLEISVIAGQGYLNIAKKVVKHKDSSIFSLPNNVKATSTKLQQLFNHRTLWPDDTIAMKKSGNAYTLQIIRDGVILETSTVMH
jgi:phosphate transport system substrate-binding protein